MNRLKRAVAAFLLDVVIAVAAFIALVLAYSLFQAVT